MAVSRTHASSPPVKGAAILELPQPLYLYELLTGSRHYHFGYFVDGPPEPVARAMARLSEECMALLEPGTRVLDVGCALGGTSMALSDAGFDVVGIDPCAAAIAYCRETVAGNPTGTRFQHTNLESLAQDEAPHGSFSGILMIEVLQHFPQLTEALHWCRRLLAPGGRLVVSDIAKLPDLLWSRVPFHRRGELARAAEDARFEVRESRDVTPHVAPTMSWMIKLVRAFWHRLGVQAAELLTQLEHLDAGFTNGELVYELTVLRRP